MTNEPDAEEGATTAPPRVRHTTGFVIGLSALGVVGGIALLIVGLLAFGRADDARAQAAKLGQDRRALEARTATAERDVDAPINDAERVAKSVTTIVEASDTVLTQSTETNGLLDQAVRLANNGRRGAADEILSGEAAASVRRLNDTLTEAQAALAAAQLAAIDLDTGTP
jgi:hypothetical protein